MTETGPAADPDKGTYRSYLLRLWQDGAHAPWRASLREVTTGQITHFATVEALLAFIAAQTGTVPGNAHDEDAVEG